MAAEAPPSQPVWMLVNTRARHEQVVQYFVNLEDALAHFPWTFVAETTADNVIVKWGGSKPFLSMRYGETVVQLFKCVPQE